MHAKHTPGSAANHGLWSSVREIFAMSPSKNDLHPAVRTAFGVGVPLITLVIVGRIDLAIFASFGAFTGIYGRGEPQRQRLRTQAKAGTLMLVVILAGALCSAAGVGTWGIVIGATIVAGLGTLATGLLRLRPAGSLFHIFAFGAISSIPGQPPLWQAMLTALVTVVLSLLIGQSARITRAHRSPWVKPSYPAFTSAQWRTMITETIQFAVAAGIAGSVATLMGIGHNYWAMVAAVVPLAGITVTHRLGRAVNRIIGTTVGLGITLFILLMGLEPWMIVIVIALMQFLAECFIMRQYAIAQAFVTPLALMSTELAHKSDPAVLIQDRAIETLIGAVVGVLLVLSSYYRTREHRPRG